MMIRLLNLKKKKKIKEVEHSKNKKKMSNKEQKKDFRDMEYRFSFALTINDSESDGNDIIIVKRDFNIYNIDEESLYSLELKECIDDVVNMIDRDLKSKSRVYMWYNYDNNYSDGEFNTPMPENIQTTFKFTLFEKSKPIISKIWSGDGYPFTVRNSVDLTNKKYKYDNIRSFEMDFTKQIAQKASADKPDLTSVIMKHISSTCASYQPKQGGKKIMYKQYIPELKLENIVVSSDGVSSSINNRLNSMRIVSDDNGVEKQLYEVYTTKYVVGDKEYDLSPKSDIELTLRRV